MTNTDYVYIYDGHKKQEIFAPLRSTYTEADDHGLITSKSCSQIVLDIKDRLPAGSFLCDWLSLSNKDPAELEVVLAKNGGCLYGKISGFAYGYSGDPDEIRTVCNVLYLLRGYIDFCVAYPQFYTPDCFSHFLNVAEIRQFFPGICPYLIKQDALSKDQIAFDLFISEPPDENSDDYIDLGAETPDHNLAVLEKRMFEFVPAHYDPDSDLLAYDIPGLLERLLISAKTLVDEHLIVKKCEICGKYFVPLLRSDAIYCDRPSPADPNLTCKQYGSQKRWYERVKKDEVEMLAKNVYSSKQMLAKRHPDIPAYKDMYDYFRLENAKWQRAIKGGEKTKGEYFNWLKKMKTQKIRDPE